MCVVQGVLGSKFVGRLPGPLIALRAVAAIFETIAQERRDNFLDRLDARVHRNWLLFSSVTLLLPLIAAGLKAPDGCCETVLAHAAFT